MLCQLFTSFYSKAASKELKYISRETVGHNSFKDDEFMK
jgi:hypothetical protein